MYTVKQYCKSGREIRSYQTDLYDFQVLDHLLYCTIEEKDTILCVIAIQSKAHFWVSQDKSALPIVCLFGVEEGMEWFSEIICEEENAYLCTLYSFRYIMQILKKNLHMPFEDWKKGMERHVLSKTSVTRQDFYFV